MPLTLIVMGYCWFSKYRAILAIENPYNERLLEWGDIWYNQTEVGNKMG